MTSLSAMYGWPGSWITGTLPPLASCSQAGLFAKSMYSLSYGTFLASKVSSARWQKGPARASGLAALRGHVCVEERTTGSWCSVGCGKHAVKVALYTVDR